MLKSQKIVASVILCLTLLAAGRAPAAQEFRVEGAGLVASPSSYAGPCPGLITFRGKIQAGGAGRVKYTYVFSDGGGGPENFVDFAGPGVKEVETTWRLGDARTLPRYDGWAVLKIISPNAYESNRAAFVLECKPGDGRQQPPPPDRQPPQQQGGPQDDFVQTYLSELPRLSAPQRQKFTGDLDGLKSFAEELQPKLVGAQKQLGLDAEALRAEFRAVAEEPDEAKRAERGQALSEKYEPRFIELLRASGVDPESERRRVAALLTSPSNDPPRTVGLLGFFLPAPARPEPPPGPPPAPDITEHVFRAPFTSRGTLGSITSADRNSGLIVAAPTAPIASSEQAAGFIVQEVFAGRGVRGVRVSANFDPVSHYALTFGALGYASAETIVNLRVMEGSRQVCSDRLSLGRAVSAVVGYANPRGTRPVTLQCEFTRGAPDTPATYHAVAELEGWAGAGGFMGATATVSGTLRQFQVLLDRR